MEINMVLVFYLKFIFQILFFNLTNIYLNFKNPLVELMVQGVRCKLQLQIRRAFCKPSANARHVL
jgi:hypothetical protein